MAVVELIDAADPATLARFDLVIDARSPGEFAEDHIPGAVNLPVLSDAERAEVGTVYVQEDRFKARRMGAALIARNVAGHLETALADKPGSFRPLVYCWRGGQRSEAMAIILSQVGWRTGRLAGGYKTYRRGIQHRLYEDTTPLNLVLIDGHTGSAKTEILQRLAARGVQTIDLEGLAEHRGSLFGDLPGRPQPSQKLFESRLVSALDRLDPARPIVVEAESSKIGERMLPPLVWSAMQAAPRITLEADRAERARYLVGAYADIVADPGRLAEIMARIPLRLGRERLAQWRALAGAGDFATLADALMETHYDPAYDRSARRDERPVLGTIPIAALDAAGQDAAADAIAALVALNPAACKFSENTLARQR
jgi:tRNA 2-selenouridine synthase